MICITRTTKKVISKARIIKKRTFKNFAPEIFIEAVSKTSWLDVYLCDDIATAVNLVSTKLNNILDEMAPVKVIQVRSHYAPWMSEKTKQKIKERYIAQKRASETQNNEEWENYRKLRNSINDDIRKEKKEWKEEKLRSYGADTGTVWKNIKTWLGWSSGGPPSKLIENGSI